ncbi:MAG: sugar transferase [Phycisphaerae bacterium]
MLKRLFDFILSGIALLFLWPFLLLIAVLIWISDPGPALFKQVRVGKDGRDFRILKFRSMRVQREAEKGSFDAGDSSRVTWIGRILRKTKIDELPQLINVFKGEMSFVGPRPEVRKWVEVYPDRWAEVHKVRPGITDPASIEFRNEEELLACSDDPEQTYSNEILPRKLDMYQDYVRQASFGKDARLMVKTASVVISGALRRQG